MDVRILGPLEVSQSEEPLLLASARQRIILAILLLNANRVVPVSRLIDAVWGQDPPRTARGQLQICISAIRRSLSEIGATGAIVTRHPGYALQLTGGFFDAVTFERFLADGRGAIQEQRLDAAVGAFREALSLWRGKALADIDSGLVQSAAHRLDELRLVTTEELLSVELSLGRHHEVISELLELVACYPLRERFRAQLMIALSRAGRQAEALESYREARTMLADELGLEPSRELRELERDILRGECGEDLHPLNRPVSFVQASLPAPALLPADIMDFSSRGQLVAEILARLGPAPDPYPGARIVALSGMGGAGKTAIALHTAHRLVDLYPDGQLYVDLHGTDQVPLEPGYALERFLRVLGVPGSMIPGGLDERAEIYRHRIADRRMLIVLDGAADEQQVMPLLPGNRACAVVVTSRPWLAGLPGAQHVHVDLLDVRESIGLLGVLVGVQRVDAEPGQATALAAYCGGLPLALRIVGARLAARPHWPLGGFVERLHNPECRLDELAYGGLSIRASIDASYAGLSPAARLLFGRLGMLAAPDFPGWAAAPLLGCDPQVSDEVLEELVDAQLVNATVLPDGHLRYRIHELIKAFARECLAAETARVTG
jgi:DNA-binding SARP family transcriptional activator